MKNLLFLFLFLVITAPLNSSFAQVQIGADLLSDTQNNSFGNSVTISDDGNRIAIGAQLEFNADFELIGSVKIFEWANDDWVQMGSTIYGIEEYDFLGRALSMSSDGNIIAIGGTANSNAQVPGKVKIYEWIAGSWIQKGGDILGEAFLDNFGSDVALSSDGTYLITGATGNDVNGAYSGHTRVHAFMNGQWVQIGEDIDGDGPNDYSGGSVDISSDGSRIAIGAALSDGQSIESGHVRVFEWLNGSWTQMGNDINGDASSDLFGGSLSLAADGSRIAIGAINNDGNAEFLGQVKVLEWTNGAWQQLGTDLNGEELGTHFGFSVSLSEVGNRLVVSASLNDQVAENTGQVKIFDWNGTEWIQLGMSIEGDDALDFLGRDTDISADGERFIVGIPGFDGNVGNLGKARVYSLAELTDIEPKLTPSLSIYPNPCTNELFIKALDFETIQIIDVYGNQVKEVDSSFGQKVDVSILPSGLYYLKVNTKEHSILEKILKI